MLRKEGNRALSEIIGCLGCGLHLHLTLIGSSKDAQKKMNLTGRSGLTIIGR